MHDPRTSPPALDHSTISKTHKMGVQSPKAFICFNFQLMKSYELVFTNIYELGILIQQRYISTV